MAAKAAPLPLSVEKEEEQQQQKKKHAPADPLFLPGVRHVIIWALFNAGCVAFSIAYALIVTSIISQPPSWLLPRPGPEPEEMTDAAVDVVVMAGMLWCVCVVSQAAAGALALALPRHRLLLAYAALVATAAGHCMWAGLHIMFVAADGGLCFRTGVTTTAIFFSGVWDLICFRGLILGGGKEDGEE